jgi:hypothetical protein
MLRSQTVLSIHNLHIEGLVGLFSVPAFPCFPSWITYLKDKSPTRAKRITARTKRCHPLLVRHEYLCHVASHSDEIGMQSFELRRSAGDPADSVGLRFPFGDVQ